MDFLRRWMLHNWWLKLLALALSFLLWATYTAEPIAEQAYVVPLEFTRIPGDLEISNEVPAQVHVRVRGRSALLRRLTPADLGVSVDLSSGRPGESVHRSAPDQGAWPSAVSWVALA